MRLYLTTLCGLVALLGQAAAAHAELGGNIATIAADQQRMKATTPAQRLNTTNPNYNAHEFTTEIGTVVREYANTDGIIFAVTWNGPTKPDLQQLLGRYFPLFMMASTQAKRTGNGPMAIATDDLIVHSGGHLRAFTGHAYVPSLTPTGVSIDALP